MSQESARLVSADQGGPQNGGRSSKSSHREAAKKTNAGQVSIYRLRCSLGLPNHDFYVVCNSLEQLLIKCSYHA